MRFARLELSSELIHSLLDPRFSRLTRDEWRVALQRELGWRKFGEVVRVGARKIEVGFDLGIAPCTLTGVFNKQRRTELRIGGTYYEQLMLEADLARVLDGSLTRTAVRCWTGRGVAARLWAPSVNDDGVKATFTYPR